MIYDMMNLENIMLMKCQTQKTKPARFHLHEVFKIINYIETQNRVGIAGGQEEEGLQAVVVWKIQQKVPETILKLRCAMFWVGWWNLALPGTFLPCMGITPLPCAFALYRLSAC